MREVTLELGEGRALLTFSRPEARNAVDVATVRALDDALSRVEDWVAEDLRHRVLIVTGSGDRAFVSGGDLREVQNLGSWEEGLDFSQRMQRLLNRLEDLPIPVIAAVNGAAVGGGSEVALACDLRVLAEDAYLSFAQIGIGLLTGWGGAGRLCGLVGWKRALGLLVTAAKVSADEACRLGLADYVAPPGGALELAEVLGQDMTSQPPLALRALKPLLRSCSILQRGEAQRQEAAVFADLTLTADHREALASILEGRRPTFSGR